MAKPDERIEAPPPGIYYDVPMVEYLAWDAWSRSEVAAMEVSAEYCKWYRDERDNKATDPMAFGTLAHTALLEPHLWPPDDVRWIAGPYNRNPMKAERTDAMERGFRVFKPEDRERCEQLAARCRRHPYIGALLELSDLEREVSAIAKCPVTGLLLKARCDLRAPSIRIIGDLKTTTVGTDRFAFGRQLRQLNYHLSGPHYVEVFGLADGDREYDTYLFLVVGQEAPYQPRVYNLDPLALEAGRDWNHHLRRKVVACLESGEWPSGPEEIEPIGLPGWKLEEMQRELELEAAKE